MDRVTMAPSRWIVGSWEARTFCLGCTLVALLASGCRAKPAPEQDRTSQRLQADPTAPQCGFDVVAPPDPFPVDPCAEGPDVITALAPQTITRHAGQPETFSFPFSTTLGGAACVHVENNGVKGSIHLDGQEVIRENMLAHPMHEVQGATAIGAGEHLLAARVRGQPGTTADVSVRFHRGDLLAPPHRPVTGPAGMVTVLNLRADPALITPDNENGIDDQATIWATVHLHNWPGSLQAHEVSLRYTLEVWQAAG